jgi:hypothetical protein
MKDFLRGWFHNEVMHKVGKRRNIAFWEEKCLGNQKLKEVFKSLFYVVLNKTAKILDLVSITNNFWGWGFEWRRELYSQGQS